MSEALTPPPSSPSYQAHEQDIYQAWERSGVFACNPESSAQPYTIMMPPPNVTGNLHLGHALTFTLQDILIRNARKQGRDTLWQPGTDHAGISTQMVVERQLAKEGLDRRTLGREAFEQRVWAWKEEYGAAITHQLRRLGASADWSRERFTLDEGLKHAVTSVFVRLYEEGLIYRDKRLVHWDTQLLTAVSDIEVENKDIDDHFCFLRYPSAENPESFLVVATTRPETLFGDVAVAVHPDDERYQAWIGQQVRLPLTDRTIPVVADLYCDPDKGTGAVKITPAHDFNDFDVAKRHQLPWLNILTEHGRLNESVPASYQGLTTVEARKKVLEALEAEGLVEKIDPIRHSVPHGDRTGVRLEPRLTDQWFVDAHTLAQPAIRAVETGETRFYPDYWSATYYEWLKNIQPWCISRQLWWGHRIPAWFGPDGKVFVAMTADEAQAQADQHYGQPTTLRHDEDVLDTWFSSALWPFSTLNWPENAAELTRYYPGDVLATGHDIIFFWVARMMMMGLHFMKAPPFRHVYIHAIVRDDKGQKMSKSKGNVIDPLTLMDTFGTDALRFSLAQQAAPGRDVKLSPTRVEGARNFTTKLKNAVRFCLMHGAKPGFDPSTCQGAHHLWMMTRVQALQATVTEALSTYRFHEAAQALYRETWAYFCDWYLEFCKPILNGTDDSAKEETRLAMFWILERLLHALNPFLPFVTEDLWAQLHPGQGVLATHPLIASSYPAPVDLPPQAREAARDVESMIAVISEVRSVWSDFNLSPKITLPAEVREASADALRMLKTHQDVVCALARLSSLSFVEGPGGAHSSVITLTLADMVLGLVMDGAIDLEKETQRRMKELGQIEKDLAAFQKKLSNADFLARAPQEIIDELHERVRESEAHQKKCLATLATLKNSA